jgi:large subunit ribosomal protein L29
MKIVELRKKTKKELEKLLKEHTERLGVLRFSLNSGRVKNVKEISQIRKEIARILTLSKESNKIS